MCAQRIATVTHPFEAFIVPPVAENLASLDDTNRCDYGLGNVRGFTIVDVNGATYTLSLYVQDDPQPRFTRTFPAAPKLKAAALQPTHVFTFTLAGELGRRYHVETSTNLLNWQPLASQTVNFPEGEEITDPLPTHSLQKFYRCWPDQQP